MAQNINEELEKVGFKNLGVKARPGLVVLRRTNMPSLLIETGFINTDADNELFDEKFYEIAQGIADGILNTLDANNMIQPIIPPHEEMPNMQTPMDNSTSMRPPVAQPPMQTPPSSQNPSGTRPPMQTPPPNRPPMMPNEPEMPELLYRVQIGSFRNRENADRLLYELENKGYPAFILFEDGLFKVQVGAFRNLGNAIRMEQRLRQDGYATWITT